MWQGDIVEIHKTIIASVYVRKRIILVLFYNITALSAETFVAVSVDGTTALRADYNIFRCCYAL